MASLNPFRRVQPRVRCLVSSGLLALTTTGLALPASSAEDDAAPTTAIEVLTVTAHRLPTAEPVLPPLQRRAAGEQTVGADVLRSLPGLAISQSGPLGGLTQLRARGAEANHLLVLLDGFELNDPAADGEFNFAHLSTATTPHLEYLPGAQSAIWGSDAVAGVLQLGSAPRGRERFLRAAAGSFATTDLHLNLADVGANGHYRLSAQQFDTDGTNLSFAGSEDDGFRSRSLLASGSRSGERWQLGALVRHLSARSDFDPAPFPAFVPVDGPNHTEHASTLVALRGAREDLAGGWSAHTDVSLLRTNNLGYAGSVRTGFSDGERRKVSLIGRSAGDAATQLSLIGEYEQERFEQRGSASPFGDPNQSQRIEQWSAGADWRLALSTRLTVALSGRFDGNSDFEDSVSHRVAVRYALTPAFSLWANHGTGIKNPSFIERFGFTPDTFFGNPGIEPEQSRHVSIGARWQRPGLDGGVTLFRDRLRDEIDGFAFDPALGGFTAVNEDGHSRRQGVEVHLGVERADWHVRGGGSYIDSRDPDGDREIRRPRWLAFAEAGGRRGALRTWTRLSYVGAQADLRFATFPATAVRLASYTLWSAAAYWTLAPRLELGLRGDNLLDQRVENVFGFAGPGRGAYLELRLSQ